MSSDRTRALDELLQFSLKMLQEAESEEWLDVIQSGISRQQLIDGFFSVPVAAEEENEVARVLREILRVNESIELLAVDSRVGVGESIGSIRQGRRAVLAYSENTGVQRD
jgi:hypothetical protein